MNKTIYLLLFICLLVFLMPSTKGIDLLTKNKEDIEVEIKGEVVNPEIITLPAYSNISDLLKLTQLTEQADLSTINLTTTLKNHDVVVIPKIAQIKKVSINAASKQELITLPQIGEVVADRIIQYRSTHGPFQQLEDLMKVKGIGSKTFEKLVDLIVL